MKIYLDMDGVLADLDGKISKLVGASRQEIISNRELRNKCIEDSIRSNGIRHYQDIPPNQPKVWKEAMRKWHKQGHLIEILTSYGKNSCADLGVLAHSGKKNWLEQNYTEELEEGVISCFNGVQFCEQKALFARPGSLLVDDQPENVEEFIKSGGLGSVYKIWSHDQDFSQVEVILKSKEFKCF